jgi:hypothetical protein
MTVILPVGVTFSNRYMEHRNRPDIEETLSTSRLTATFVVDGLVFTRIGTPWEIARLIHPDIKPLSSYATAVLKFQAVAAKLPKSPDYRFEDIVRFERTATSTLKSEGIVVPAGTLAGYILEDMVLGFLSGDLIKAFPAEPPFLKTKKTGLHWEGTTTPLLNPGLVGNSEAFGSWANLLRPSLPEGVEWADVASKLNIGLKPSTQHPRPPRRDGFHIKWGNFGQKSAILLTDDGFSVFGESYAIADLMYLLSQPLKNANNLPREKVTATLFEGVMEVDLFAAIGVLRSLAALRPQQYSTTESLSAYALLPSDPDAVAEAVGATKVTSVGAMISGNISGLMPFLREMREELGKALTTKTSVGKLTVECTPLGEVILKNSGGEILGILDLKHVSNDPAMHFVLPALEPFIPREWFKLFSFYLSYVKEAPVEIAEPAAKEAEKDSELVPA